MPALGLHAGRKHGGSCSAQCSRGDRQEIARLTTRNLSSQLGRLVRPTLRGNAEHSSACGKPSSPMGRGGELIRGSVELLRGSSHPCAGPYPCCPALSVAQPPGDPSRRPCTSLSPLAFTKGVLPFAPSRPIAGPAKPLQLACLSPSHMGCNSGSESHENLTRHSGLQR